MSNLYQSPISAGRSWYEDTCGERPSFPSFKGDRSCDVIVIGGGFCGVSAALRLAEAGSDAVLIEAHRIGDGASGRNGGQMGTGPRDSMADLEADLGQARARALWDMAEAAKSGLHDKATRYGIDMDYVPGQMTVMHRGRYEKEARSEVEHLRERYGYTSIEWLDRKDMAEALGSTSYYGGSRDTGTGHIHPMKLLIGLANAAREQGAELYEHTPALSVESTNGKIIVTTPEGHLTAPQAILALNGYHGDFLPEIARTVMPIQSFIGATVPLPDDCGVLPGGEAVDDSRFVVRYFRRTRDNRLLFGGREAYGRATPGDIRATISRQIADVYPQIAGVELTHAWGGNVAITMPRRPYVRELSPGLWTAGGFSGHGVMLSNHTGTLLAERLIGESDTIRHLADLDIPAFPGGTLFRNPLKTMALTWYAMLDRF